MNELTKQQQYTQGLRDLAEFYESHPEVPLPSFSQDFTIYGLTKEELSVVARAFGTAEKKFDDEHFQLIKKFGGGVQLATFSDRNKVCELVKVGEKMTDIMEWRCGSVLATEEVTA